MIGLKPTGPDARKSEFFRQMAAAYLLMADFYVMSQEDQDAFLQMQMKLVAQNLPKGGNNRG